MKPLDDFPIISCNGYPLHSLAFLGSIFQPNGRPRKAQQSELFQHFGFTGIGSQEKGSQESVGTTVQLEQPPPQLRPGGSS